MQFFQAYYRHQCRNNSDKQGEQRVAEQNDSDALRIPDVADRAGKGLEKTLEREFRDRGFPRSDTDWNCKKTEGVERENGVGSSDSQKQSSQGWTHNRRDVQLQSCQGRCRGKLFVRHDLRHDSGEGWRVECEPRPDQKY